MLALDIQHNGKNLSVELPIPIDVLIGELQAIGINAPINDIALGDMALHPINELGEHFMKMVQPTDTLQTIAIFCRELEVLTGESREQLAGLILADRFRDLDHMTDYLQHGLAKLTHITLDELRGMTNQEGLILQGCGGEPQEWLDGINEILAEEGILLNGDQFRKASIFEHEDLINILFHMDNVDLDIGKLAMWRLKSHGTFGGTWLSDYLPNRLGIHAGEVPRPSEPQKPDCPLVGSDNNIFSLIGLAT